MGSHDFASTYVGTPFYMSPEISAGERYTLHSDIWSVGCIMYELCKKEPPFNARTHVQLVQKIREGKFAPLPDVYSSELRSVIASCLRVNPDHRPDTAALLKLPVIRLMRKEQEVVEISKSLTSKEEAAAHKLKDLEQRYAKLEKEKVAMRTEIENTVRREWEVKARLEIDRQVQMELDKLRRTFELEVEQRVASEMQKYKEEMAHKHNMDLSQLESAHHSSLGSSDDTDFPSSTDLSELSLDPPTPEQKKAGKKGDRTPFSRSKTTVESPMDVQMAEPSPISLASLSLSPRRTAGTSAKNIFADGGRTKPKWDTLAMYSDDEDDIPDLPSPTRTRVQVDPSKAPHRPLLRQNTTAMMQKLSTQPNLFPVSKAAARPAQTTNSAAPQPNDARNPSVDRNKSPQRRLSKIPSYNNLALEGSPSRKTAMMPPQAKAGTGPGGDEMFKAIMQRNMGGRSLVELAQARAGGRSLDELKRPGDIRVPATGASAPAAPSSLTVTQHDPPATWDPEKDEMPSPFLVRNKKVIRNFR